MFSVEPDGYASFASIGIIPSELSQEVYDWDASESFISQ